MDDVHVDGLRGLEAIEKYTGYCSKVVRRLIREKGFPAVKIGGSWESSKRLVDGWRRKMIMGLGKG